MLDVIGAGFGRTGTASLKVALERLGFGPCYHMFEVIGDTGRVADWENVVAGGDVDWDAVFAGYRSTVDWPGAAYWRELVQRCPDAPVVLTVRDPHRWYRSTYDTIYQFAKHGGPPPDTDPASAEVFERLLPVLNKMIWDGTFSGRFEDAAYAMQVFDQHNDHVRRSVSDDRLLVYEVSQGWQPLCEHLGVPVPDEPFPHVNQAQSVVELVRTVLAGQPLPSPFGSAR